jgi:hypothetical protein
LTSGCWKASWETSTVLSDLARRCIVRNALVAPALVLLICGVAGGEIPQVMGYQGRITDNTGNPVADGTYTMRFRIVTAPTGGIVVWDSGNQSVQVSGGVFSVELGESPQPALALDFDQDYWLLVTFDGENQTPRKRLGSVGYAYMASGLVPGTEVSGSVSGSFAVIKATNSSTSGGYGIHGVVASTDGRALYGEATATTGLTYGVFGRSDCPDGRGVFGYASATTGYGYGVYGNSASTAGYGVLGYTSASTGDTYGGRFESASWSGRGVYGYASATTGTTYGGHFASSSPSGTGVYGMHDAATGTDPGVLGATNSTGGAAVGVLGRVESTAAGGYSAGVRGINNGTGGNGIGVWGSQDGTGWGVYGTTFGGRAVYGRTSAGSGYTYGVYGESASTDGRGVYGIATATTFGYTYGVYGTSASMAGCGVYGRAPAWGVYGETYSTTGVAVLGRTTNCGTAVKAEAAGSSAGPIYGVHSQSSNYSDGTAHGGYFVAQGTGPDNGMQYGVKTEAYGLSPDDTHGIFGYGQNTSSGEFYGGRFIAAYDGCPGTGPRTGAMGEAYGNSSGTLYGVCGWAKNQANATVYAGWFWAEAEGTGPHYGVYSKCYGSSAAWPTFGVHSEAHNPDDAATVYGGYFYAHDAGQVGPGEHYGVYAYEASGGDGAAIWCDGDLTYTGKRSAVVKTSRGHRLLAGTESPESWVEDYGEGALSGGRATIAVDPLLLEVMAISAEHPMKVFVQLTSGDPMDLVVRKGLTSFEVVAEDPASAATFDYRVVAKRKGYENVRLEATQTGLDSPNLYPGLRAVIAERDAEERRQVAERQRRSPVYARRSP